MELKLGFIVAIILMAFSPLAYAGPCQHATDIAKDGSKCGARAADQRGHQDINPGDTKVKKQIINHSITSYSGTCACPYSKDKKGHNCGARSAYSKAGGATTICYEKDVTPEMVANFNKQK